MWWYVEDLTCLLRRYYFARMLYPIPHSTASWSDRLAFDVALMLEGSGEPLDRILELHQVTHDDLLVFNRDPLFLKKVGSFRDEIVKNGLTFKLKARAQAEELLTTSYLLIHDLDTPPSVKADLIKWTAKVAGYEPRSDAPQSDLGSGVSITINLASPAEDGPKLVGSTSTP